MRSLFVAIVVMLANAAGTGAADISLAAKPPLSDDPVQCHWSFSISVLAIAEACKPVEHAGAVKALGEINVRLNDYMRARSGLDAAEIDRQAALIRELTLSRVKPGPDGQCAPDDWAQRIYPFDMDGEAMDFSRALDVIDTLLAANPAITEASCQ